MANCQFYGILVPNIITTQLYNIALASHEQIKQEYKKEGKSYALGYLKKYGRDDLSIAVNDTTLIHHVGFCVEQENIDLFFKTNKEFFKNILDLIPSLTCDIVYGVGFLEGMYTIIRRDGVLHYDFL